MNPATDPEKIDECDQLMNLTYLPLILLSVIMSTGAQLVLKFGANKINSELQDASGLWTIALTVLNMPILVGLCIYVISAATWIWVLTKVDISVAYPFISLGFVMTLVFGALVFDEGLSASKIIGTVLIIAGCIFIARS